MSIGARRLSRSTITEVATATTLFGACPTNPGGESLNAALTVSTKFGAGAYVRQFKINLSAPNSSPLFGGVHTSYKPDISSMLNGSLDSAIAAVAAATPNGHVLEVWHEADRKVKTGQFTDFQEAVDVKNRFYDVVKATNPNVLVANTLTGWESSPSNSSTNGNIDKWADVRADIIGLDYDGIHDWPYPTYSNAQIAVATAFVANHSGYSYWAIPEFGTGTQSNDPNQTTRAAWASEHANRFIAAGAMYCCWYDFDADGIVYTMTEQAEIDAWAGRV